MLLDFQVLFAYPVDRHGDVNFCDKTNKTIRSYRGFAALYKCPATTAHPFIIRLVRSNTYGARSETIKSNPSNGHLPRAPANGHIAVGVSSTMQYADVFLVRNFTDGAELCTSVLSPQKLLLELYRRGPGP